MIRNVTGCICIMVPFVWIGFICSISFMEAWIKFTPPNVTLVIGLSIGKAVFYALNKVELVFTVILGAAIFLEKQWAWDNNFFYFIASLIVFGQSIWMLPYLAARIDTYLTGNTPPSSPVHVYFIILEGIKTISLFMFGSKRLTLWKALRH